MRRSGLLALPALALASVLLLTGCAPITGVAFDTDGDGYCLGAWTSETIYVGLFVTNDSDRAVRVAGVSYGSLDSIEPVDAWIVPIPETGSAIGIAGPEAPDLPQWDDRVAVEDAELPAHTQMQLVVELRTTSTDVDAWARGISLQLDGGTIATEPTIGILSPDGARECSVEYVGSDSES